jgi:hypothetical protein
MLRQLPGIHYLRRPEEIRVSIPIPAWAVPGPVDRARGGADDDDQAR